MRLSLPVTPMRYIALLLFPIPVTGCAAFSYEPAGEQGLQQIASGGCRNRDGDFTTLNELRQSRTPVVVTLRCQGDGTPMARSLSYRNVDGSSESISY